MRISLRWMLAAVAIVAIALGLVTHRYRARKAAYAILSQRNCSVWFDDHRHFQDGEFLKPDGMFYVTEERSGWLPRELTRSVKSIHLRRETLDEESLWAIAQLEEARDVSVNNASATKRDCEALARMPSLSQVGFHGSKIETGALAAFADCESLTCVWLAFSNATDADCELLAKCSSLTELVLHGTDIGDAGLRAITRLPHLSEVHLSGGAITKQGVEHLLANCKLTLLYCSGDDFGEEWWAEIAKRYPNCNFGR